MVFSRASCAALLAGTRVVQRGIPGHDGAEGDVGDLLEGVFADLDVVLCQRAAVQWWRRLRRRVEMFDAAGFLGEFAGGRFGGVEWVCELDAVFLMVSSSRGKPISSS